MYKTVRHGENSLQYTILPQAEEVFVNSGVKGKGRDYSPSIHMRPYGRWTTVRYVVIVLCGIMLALALLCGPLYFVNLALYVRRSMQNQHDVNSAASMLPTGRDIMKPRKKELEMSPKIVASSSNLPILDTTATPAPITSPTTAVPITVAKDRATTPPWTIPALRPWKKLMASTTVQPIPTESIKEVPPVATPSGNVQLLDHYMSLKPREKNIIITPTVTPAPIGLRNLLKYYPHASISHTPVDRMESPSGMSKMLNDMLMSTTTTTTTAATAGTEAGGVSKMKDLKDTLLSVDDDEEFKESLEMDEVFSLPPSKPDTAASGSDSDEVTVLKASDVAWYGAQWPFVDTSSYFQWTGYSARDNLVLLPLLTSALSLIALIFLIIRACRRYNRARVVSAQIRKLTADLQAEDKKKLLTVENPEEPEE